MAAPHALHIVLACDAGYAMPLATTLRSLADSNNAGHTMTCHVLCSDMPEEARLAITASLPANVAVRWVSVDLGAFEAFDRPPHISSATYARLLIPHLLPADISRVLYLDADILVLGDLGPLWELDLGGLPVGAVADGMDLHMKRNTPGPEGLPRVNSYFNAGVLLIDLDRWRALKISETALAYLDKHPRSPFCDQDGLNVACDGLWVPLDPRWNFQAHTRTRVTDLPREDWPRVMHFVTSLKPWIPANLNANAALYDSFRRRTRFARTRRERYRDTVRTTVLRAKRRLASA